VAVLVEDSVDVIANENVVVEQERTRSRKIEGKPTAEKQKRQ
jgi:hypothetical protein